MLICAGILAAKANSRVWRLSPKENELHWFMTPYADRTSTLWSVIQLSTTIIKKRLQLVSTAGFESGTSRDTGLWRGGLRCYGLRSASGDRSSKFGGPAIRVSLSWERQGSTDAGCGEFEDIGARVWRRRSGAARSQHAGRVQSGRPGLNRANCWPAQAVDVGTAGGRARGLRCPDEELIGVGVTMKVCTSMWITLCTRSILNCSNVDRPVLGRLQIRSFASSSTL